MESNINIHDLEVPQLQALVTGYPWFSYARELLLYRLVEIEPQCLESRYKEFLVFFPARERVLLKARGIVAAKAGKAEEVPVMELMIEDDGIISRTGNEVEPLEELSLDIDIPDTIADSVADVELDIAPQKETMEEAVEVQPVKPRIVVVGGDYFSKEDFAQLDESEKAADIKFGAPADDIERDVHRGDSSDRLDYDTLDFVTETLAKIYADQGYYDKAIEVYAKLILLYPEKSTYFATLVNEIKSKN